MVRLIIVRSPDGGEEVTFTEDFEANAVDFLRPGWIVAIDAALDVDLPREFPIEHTLVVSQ